VNADGYETVVPSFARDASDNLPRAVETVDDQTLLDEPNLLNIADDVLTQYGDVAPDNSRIGDRMRAGRMGKRAVPATALNSSEGGEGKNQKSALASGAPLMSVGPRPDGPYIIYLAGGPERDGSFSKQLSELSNASTVTVLVDTEVGGYAHDLTDPVLLEQLVSYAEHPLCIAHRSHACGDR
jgi:hypothetical protein